MADIQTGRFGRLLQAAFNLKQRMTLGQTLPDVMPVFDLVRPAPDFALHAGVDFCHGHVIRAAVAAQYSSAYLYAPTAANRIVVLERVSVLNFGAAAIGAVYALGAASAAPASAAAFSEQYRDARLSSRGAPSAQMRAGTSAVSIYVNVPGVVAVPPGDIRVVEGPWILGNTGVPSLPNAFFQIQNTAVNIDLYVVFQWYERNLDPSELVN